MLKNKKFIIGGIVIFLAIGYLGFMGFQASATYYYTVSEFTTPESMTYDENTRISGDILTGSVKKPGALTLQFTVTEGGQSLPVFYQGAVPDSFQEGNGVVLEGYLDGQGVFQAHTLLVKCPTKYVPEGDETQ